MKDSWLWIVCWRICLTLLEKNWNTTMLSTQKLLKVDRLSILNPITDKSFIHKLDDKWHPDGLLLLWICPTVLLVECDLHLPLLGAQQRLRHLRDRQPLGVRAVEKVTGARLLHDLSTRVAAHVTEAIVTEDDGAVLHSSVGYDEFSACEKENIIISTFSQKIWDVEVPPSAE